MQSIQRLPLVTLPGACSIAEGQTKQSQHRLVNFLVGYDHQRSPAAERDRCVGQGPGSYRRLVAVSYPLMAQMAEMTRRIDDNLVEACRLWK